MNIRTLFLCLFTAIVLIAGCPMLQATAKPNIIYIFADDLGYGEVGVYGQEKIETPNIDALAQNGIMFTQHYSASPVCAPARYNLMTGKHPGNSYIRSNSENAPQEHRHDHQGMIDNPEWEGQTSILSNEITVAQVLKEAGYHTGAIGKWGLGGPGTEGHPNKQGFDFFYGYLCQRMAHTYYPAWLWKNEERIYLDNDMVVPHQELADDLDPYDPDNYTLFHNQPDYSATLMQDEAIHFIEKHQKDPFFLYLPTPIPHVSLQAPQRWIDYYFEKFGDEEPYLGGHYVPVRYPNATYAAMISYMDEQVGEIVDKLKELDIYENTVIIFTSDNGPTFTGGVDAEFFDSAAPFLTMNTRGRTKGFVYEGGIRVPMIASWEGRTPAGSTTDHLSVLWDVLPTLSEIAGVKPPDHVDGISFLPVLLGEENKQQEHDFLYWEFHGYGGQQAVRMGSWKGVRKNINSEGNLDIELYNLDEDIQELHNIADEYPDRVLEMEYIMNTARTIPELDLFKMRALGDFE